MCSLLLTHPSIRWNTVDKERFNAFHIAAQNNHSELIQCLWNHLQKPRFYLDAQNEDGKNSIAYRR